jgi:hypothetical protein
MSLSRLWQQQGKYAKAHPLLAEVYNPMFKGSETVEAIF